MNLKKYMSTFVLATKINRFRRKKQNSPGNNNEKCENYYRVDDVEKDGRGSY